MKNEDNGDESLREREGNYLRSRVIRRLVYTTPTVDSREIQCVRHVGARG